MKQMTLLLAAAALATALVFACGKDQEILVGFSGQLTGTFSDLGVQGRNGATLAMEELNASGGVAGRTLKLLVQNDANTPEGAVQADTKLLDAGVVAVIGHMTSAQTLAVIELFEARRAVLISPTTATPQLTGKPDHFFRLIPDNRSWATTLASYAANAGIGRVYLLGDADNASYVDAFNQAFEHEYARHAGTQVRGKAAFSSRSDPDWQRLLADVLASGATGVVLAASARDVAQFAKAKARQGAQLAILCPTWPYTREILLAGGASVEGIIFSTSYTEETPYPRFAAFAKRYEERFGWPPNFAAAYGYEAVLLLAKALSKTGGSRQGLKEALVDTGVIQGAMGDFSLDANGDVNRDNFIVTIRDGHFRTVTDAR